MPLLDVVSTALSEVLSTAFLVIFTCAIQIFDQSLLTISAVHGLAHLVIANCFGQISGAHANPAISISIWWRNIMSFKRLSIYVASQIGGAVLGHYALCKLLDKPLNDLPCGAIPSENLSDWSIVAIEFGLTFLIVLSWCALWKRDNTPIELYLCVVSSLVCLLGFPLTGASANPAKYLAPLFFSEKHQHAYLYLSGQLSAAIAAPILWSYLSEM